MADIPVKPKAPRAPEVPVIPEVPLDPGEGLGPVKPTDGPERAGNSGWVARPDGVTGPTIVSVRGGCSWLAAKEMGV